MKSAIVKRSIVVAGHKTSVSLEDAFWLSLKQIGHIRRMTLSALVASIDTHRQYGNLSSAIRLFVLDHFNTLASKTSNDGAEAPIGMPRLMHDGGRSQQMNGRTNGNG
jgi:predicted DNA-binding ribbon-helix-helix protein